MFLCSDKIGYAKRHKTDALGHAAIIADAAERPLMPICGADDTVAVMSGAPVHILGWDEERQVWLARRDGEPSFVWVQDFADAYQAAHVSRGVDLIVPAAIYREWIAIGDAPESLPRGVLLSAQ